MLLSISLLSPFLGPLLLASLRRTRQVAAAVDGFVLLAIAGLVCLHALPESFGQLGWPAIVAAVAGLFLPKVLHAPHPPAPEAGTKACQQAHPVNWVGLLAASALLLHALADGVGLVQPEALGHAHAHSHGHAHSHAWLPWAVALHRLVEGTGLWWLLRTQSRAWVRWGALAGLGCATALGYVCGAWAQERGFAPVVALLQASVAGSLGHVLLWHAPAVPTAAAPPRPPAGPGRTPQTTAWLGANGQQNAASALGGAVAVVLLLALSASESQPDFAWAQAPAQLRQLLQRPGAALAAWVGLACLGALAVVALQHAWRGHAGRARRKMRARWREALAGTLAGLGQAACSCGVLPLAATLRRRGAKAAYVLAFVASAPALGLVALALSFTLLGPQLTLLRALGVAALALGAGLAAPKNPRATLHRPAAMLRQDSVTGASRLLAGSFACGHGARAPLGGRLADGATFALGEVLDFTAPWLLAGWALSLAVQHLLAPEAVVQLAQTGLEVGVLTLVAAPLYLCAAASTLVAATLLGKGVSIGACLAFLWSSSSLSPALLAAWRRGERRATSHRFVCVMLGGAYAGGSGVNWVCARLQSGVCTMPWPAWQLQPLAPAWTAAGCLLAGVLVARALLRQGVRGAAAQLAVSNRVGPASHHHGH